MSAVRLSPLRVDDIVDVMAEAFRGYPVMRWVAAGGEASDDIDDIDARERRLVDLFVRRRIRRGGPAFGVLHDGVLAGAAILTLPVEPDPPPDVAVMAEATWRALGDGARTRYEAYAAAASLFGDLPPHHHLNMIGVRDAYRGRGVARPLIDAVCALAEADPASAGVSLTTEKPGNVEIYRHFGFEVVATASVEAAVETWGMFLRIR